MANPFSNTVKFLKAINLLASPNGASVKRLMESINISRRSVFRLLNALEELGFPLTESQQHPKSEKTYRLSESYILKLPNIAIPNPFLTADEIIYIQAVMKTCKQYKLLNNTSLFNSVINKLEAVMPTGETSGFMG